MPRPHSNSTSISINLNSPTGPSVFELPIPLSETWTTDQVCDFLYPTGSESAPRVADLRSRGQLLAFECEGAYRYPSFQFDHELHRIRPVVAYANGELDSNGDPWGSLSWWFSSDRVLEGKRPADLVVNGELTVSLVKLLLDLSARGMS